MVAEHRVCVGATDRQMRLIGVVIGLIAGAFELDDDLLVALMFGLHPIAVVGNGAHQRHGASGAARDHLARRAAPGTGIAGRVGSRVRRALR